MKYNRLIRHRKYLVLVLLCCWPLPPNGSTLPPSQSDASQGAGRASSPQAGTDANAGPSNDAKPKGGMHPRNNPLFLIPLLAALSLQSHSEPSIGQKAAAVPSLNSLQAETPTERFVLKSVHDGREANLSNMKDRGLSARFVNTLLFRTAASAVPSKLVLIRGATVQGELSVPKGSSPVPNNIVFIECTFENTVNLSAGRFEQSLIFIDSIFHKGLRLELAQVKGDIFFIGGSVDDMHAAIQITLSRAHVDGQLQVLAMHVQNIAAEALKVQNVMFVLDDSQVETILLPQIDTESLSLAHAGSNAEGRVGTLNIEQGIIRSELWLQDLRIDSIDARGLHVDGITAFDPNVTVENSLDLSDTHHGQLTWSVPPTASPTQRCPELAERKATGPGWPCEILASGLTFDDLAITRGKSNVDLNTEFLEQARSSESAFMAYEQILRSRGQLGDADTVYSGMHEKRRVESWLSSKGSYRGRLSAIVFWLLDKGQAIFLGYGRFPLPPVLWSMGFVLLGVLMFSNTAKMEPVKKDEPGGAAYARFWYSLELFLPVVDLGMAKNWKPKESCRGLRTYARLHQLAGWVLIPVTLAALTGVIK